MKTQKGGFTLPGEAGYEKLTLELAQRWGADVIRDSDGTELSPELTEAGYDIYSTICIIRDHNKWAKANPDKLQMSFLSTSPVTAACASLDIPVMADFFSEQFEVAAGPDSMRYWQVYDRTSGLLLPREKWSYDEKSQIVSLDGITPWHKYSVSFLANRIWEEISMYNHVTNSWTKEHLMQVDPIHPAAQQYLLDWMEKWCVSHPHTTVVRFTSLFYNFVWIWGSDGRNRHRFADWASYDFTVSPLALDLFEKSFGYALAAEDFINGGNLRPTHRPADLRKLDWMAFMGEFVAGFAKQLVDIVHKHGKKAYVFYDDSWVGMEPYGKNFESIGFDGIIKCVFSGYEARLCAGVKAATHELRLHPYLFPVGLGGAPTFSGYGDPTLDAKKYWISVRRALLRQPVERIGLGGYLHLVEPYPDFVEAIAGIKNEFDMIRGLHGAGKPHVLGPRVAVLHAWGKLRSWTLSGHFHETLAHDLIHIIEALSGLPFDVEFLSFEDIVNGVPAGIDVIINAGAAGTAWSGGDSWKSDAAVESLTKWTYEGGVFLGVGEPSATDGYDTFLRMAHVLGVDRDDGRRVCHGVWAFETQPAAGLLPDGYTPDSLSGIHLTDGKARVLAESGGLPVLTSYAFGSGMGVYLSSFAAPAEKISARARTLANVILYAAGGLSPDYVTDNPETECAYFPESRRLVLINNSGESQTACVPTEKGSVTRALEPYETAIITLE